MEEEEQVQGAVSTPQPWQPARKQGPWSHSHEELNSANNRCEHEKRYQALAEQAAS